MIRLIYFLCLTISLTILSGCEKKESPYADSCLSVFKASETLHYKIKTNRFTAKYVSPEAKEYMNKVIDLAKNKLATMPKNEQAQICPGILKKTESDIQKLDNAKSEEDVLSFLIILKQKNFPK